MASTATARTQQIFTNTELGATIEISGSTSRLFSPALRVLLGWLPWVITYLITVRVLTTSTAPRACSNVPSGRN
eukprot:IDg4117t1